MPFPDAKYPHDQRLIEAADDLLFACKCAEADLTGLIDTFDLEGEPVEATLADLTAAITKAEGREA